MTSQTAFARAATGLRTSFIVTLIAATVGSFSFAPVAAANAQERSRSAAHCLTTALYFEARGEPESGQAAVAAVVLNRVSSPKWPDTVCGVVFQNQHRRNACQFSFACDGLADIARERGAWAKAERIAEQVLNGQRPERQSVRATHYHAHTVNPRWASAMQRVATIGNHIFYREI